MNVLHLNNRSSGRLPGLIGIEIVDVAKDSLTSRLDIRDELLAPNGFLHAATIVALADTTCGYGTVCSLPMEASSFTTLELKTNFIGTARKGAITCKAERVHAGRTTEVWDARVMDEAGKVIALFRCTQLIMYSADRSRSKATEEDKTT
ncbi:MAG TPA: PaaI family thioesterase [Candidatus Obscuribacterales bacterium]